MPRLRAWRGRSIVRGDDPRLEKAHAEMVERVRKFDERMLTVLKSHLGCEQFLNELLAASSKPWKGKMCGGKIDIAKGLKLPEMTEPIWKVLETGNRLRNAIAHGKPESVIADRMAKFRKAYLAALSPEQAKGSADLDDIRLVILAFGFVGAFLVVSAERVREGKQARSNA
jgi:hypothetical protein